MTKSKSSPPLQDLAARIERLRTETEQNSGRKGADPEPKTGLGMAFAISTHMVAGLGVGAGIGYFLDRWLDTSPGMLIAFFVLGAAAGFLNVYRTVSRYGMAFGYRPAEGVKTNAADTDMSIDEGPELPGGKKDNGA